MKLKEKILRYLKRLLGVHSPSRWGEIIIRNKIREKNHSYYERNNRKDCYDEVRTIALVVETRDAGNIGDIATVKK